MSSAFEDDREHSHHLLREAPAVISNGTSPATTPRPTYYPSRRGSSSSCSASIPITHGSSAAERMRRTASENQLYEDEVEADYKDFMFYSRIVNGIMKQSSERRTSSSAGAGNGSAGSEDAAGGIRSSSFKYETQQCLENIVRARHDNRDTSSSSSPFYLKQQDGDDSLVSPLVKQHPNGNYYYYTTTATSTSQQQLQLQQLQQQQQKQQRMVRFTTQALALAEDPDDDDTTIEEGIFDLEL